MEDSHDTKKIGAVLQAEGITFLSLNRILVGDLKASGLTLGEAGELLSRVGLQVSLTLRAPCILF